MHGLDVIILKNARAAGREAALATNDQQLRSSISHEEEVERISEKVGRAAALKVDGAFLEAFFNEPR